MKIRNLWCAIIVLGCTFFLQKGNAQITNLDYQIRYNTTTCRWDAFIIINGGSATSAVHRAQSNAQYSIVVPTGSTVSIAQNFNPIQNNQTYMGTTPMIWQKGSQVNSPAIEPQSDFHSIVPTLVPSSFFNNLVALDTVKLFSLNINPMPDCAAGIRIFRNGIDPPSSAPGMGGGDFSNGYTVGGTAQRYRANLPQRNPPPPVLSATTTCSGGIEVDLVATTSSCQTPMTYQWQGPNGYSGTTQDINISPSTSLNAGIYTVTVTDSKGCKSTTNIEAVSKPNAGNDVSGCPSTQYTLTGSDPNTGSWGSLGSNPPGGVLTPGVNGQASVQFDQNAVGNYEYIYDIGACSDTVQIAITQVDAGDDPATVSCYITGSASLGATGVGVWTIGAGSAGTANINNPIDPNTTVSGFSASGTYFFVWTIGTCTDTVQFAANDECSCAITNNTLSTVNPSNFCGVSGNIGINGAAASPPGGDYLWIYSFNNGTYSSATGTNNLQNYTTTVLGQGVHRFRRVYSLPSAPGCVDSSNVIILTVNNNPGVPVNLVANPNPACLGEIINLSVTNVSGNTYTWSASSPSAGLVPSSSSNTTMNPLVAGNYTISVTASANGCTSSAASVVVEVFDTPPTPDLNSVTFTNPTSCNGTDGTISFSGLTPFTTYTINYTRNGSNQSAQVTAGGTGVAILIGLNAAIYGNFTIVTLSGCPSDLYVGPVNLIDPNAPPAPSGLAASPNPTCENILINLSVTNNPGATYTWSSTSPGAGLGTSTSNTNTMLPTTNGFFNIMVTQTVAGCTSPSASIGVSVNASPPTPNVNTVSSTNPTTCGGSNGTITLSGYFSNTSYQVEYFFNANQVNTTISTGVNGNIVITGLMAGVYTNFRITNISGCSSAVYPGPVNLTNPITPSAPANLTATPNPVCLGNSVLLSVTNTPGATYAWTASSPNAGLNVTSLSSNSMLPTSVGSYMISVTQTIAGCTSPSTSITVIANPNAPTPVSALGTNPSTCSGTDGFITLTGFGSFITYTVNYLRNSVPVSQSLTSNNAGEILIIGLNAGVYTNFNVTNSFNCTSGTLAGPVLLSDPNAPLPPAGLTANPNPACEGVVVNLSVTNNPGATYTWTASNNNAGLVSSTTNATTMTSNVAGTYTISVSQTVGSCMSPTASIAVIVLDKPETPVANQFSSINPTTCGGTDGTISISGLLANASYVLNYSFNSNPQSANLTASAQGVVILTNLSAGSYNNFQLTNSDGCQSGVSPHSLILSDPNSPPAPENFTAIPNPICLGSGTVALSVNNVPGAIYTWSTMATGAGLGSSTTNTNTMVPTTTGLKTIMVFMTVNGCASIPSGITVNVYPVPPAPTSLTILATNPSSCGGNNGNINLSGYGSSILYRVNYTKDGNPFVADIISDASGNVTINNLSAGTYSNISIQSLTFNCPSDVYTGLVVLVDPSAPPLPSNLTAVPNPACLGVTINLNVTGEMGATFAWSASSAQAGLGTSSTNQNWLMPTNAGTYLISVTQSLGSCTSPSAVVSVVVNPIPPTPTAGNITFNNPSVCSGSDGSISISGYIANQSYTVNYSKNGVPAMVTNLANGSGVLVINNLTAGVYSNFSITSAAGCSSGVFAGPVNLSDPNSPPAPANLTAIPNPACLGVTVNLSVTNNPGATYSWTISDPSGGLGTSTTNTNVMNATVASTYTVQVSQTIAGCTSPNASIQVIINSNPPTPNGNTVSKIDPTCDFSNGSISISALSPNTNYTLNFQHNGSPMVYNGTTNAGGILTMFDLSGGQYTNFVLVSAQGCSSGMYAGPVSLMNPGLPPVPNGIRISPDFICVKNNVELSVDPIQGASYNWYASSPFAGLVQSANNTASMIPTLPGLYSVSVTQTINGCTSPPAITEVEVRGDCFNPDFDVTYVNVTVNGNVRSNDGVPAPYFTSISSIAGNPSACIPVLQNDGSYTFTCGVAGIYNFEVNSCAASCESVPLVITVLEENSNNKPPVVNHDYSRTRMNVPITINILANDRCQNSLSCTLNQPTMITPPTRGSFNILSGVYTPNSNFVGIDSFRYEVCQTPIASPVNCRRTWVYVTIISTQARNVTNAMDDYGQTSWNTQLNKSAINGLLANDTDPEGNTQSITSFTSSVPGIGNLAVNSDGSYLFTPESGFYGPYYWTYQVCDNNISTACDQATLHILVDPENVASKVGNYVWLDNNGNGIQDFGEPGMPNIEVRLYNDSGILMATTLTSGSGAYMFDNVLAGNYYVRVITPLNHVYSPSFVGDPLTDSNVTGLLGPGTTNFFSVLPGEDRMDIDAGLHGCSRISGYLWYDYHMNDIKDNFENGLNGVFVFLWRNVNGTYVKWAQTNTGYQPGVSEDGYFNFPCVPPGQYYIEVDLPLVGLVRVRPNIGNNPNKDSDITNANGPMTTNTFTLTSGQNKTDLGAGFYQMAVAGNLVWIDENINGIQDPGEPLVEGVVVEARDPQTHTVKGTSVTNEYGEYFIEYLERSNVYLKFELPGEYQSFSRTFARIGDDALNSDVDNTFGSWTTRSVSMEPSQVNENIDMGIVQGALPVTWVDVSVFKDKNHHHVVSWEITNEVNLSHYDVERSLNNVNDFVAIENHVYPLSAQNINKIYSALDRDNQKFGVYYYRIKQVDLDGKYTYSKTVSIRNNNEWEVNIYPSPAIHTTTANIQLPDESTVKIELFDVSSRYVATLLESSSFERGNHEIHLDLTNVVSGVYSMTIMIEDQVITKKLVVLDK